MSKQKPTKKRKTRLKGTDTQKPCLVCKKTKDRFKDFKPRWAGCELHRTERGRRYFQPGCVACAAKVNGNIRQPRCIECDSKRPKKGAAKKATVTPTPTPVVEVYAEELAVSPEAQVATEAILAPEPVVVVAPEPEVVALDEPSPESVTLPEPEARPQIASMSDLSKLFGGDDSDGE
jgi:hypothetical protein